jgi:quercetin dioxygenase-like cupin family protein
LDNLDRATIYNTVDIIDYTPNELATGSIMSKTTGSVTLVAYDADVKGVEKIRPFDTLVQILEGTVDYTIDHKTHHLKAGQCIILPAHFRNHSVSKTRCKMLLTVIKSGYEDVM